VDSFRRDGLTFDVRDEGPPDGEPVVLLHGFPQDSTAWARVAPALHQHGLRTLAPDQRGYSPMARPRGRACYQLRETVDDIVALLDTAGLESAHVVGHDWGAHVAWALAAWHPDRLRTLTVLSVPHPAALTKSLLASDQAFRLSYMGVFQLPLLPERLLLAAGGTPLRRALRHGGCPGDAVDRYVTRMQEPGALSAALGWYRALPWSARDPVGRVRVPTLHVWSTDDPVLGRAATEATEQFVDARYRLVILDGVSHWIPEREPDRVAELVASHVRGG
jgi:pimeloyl-ACP methyl ester carboxylesterase